MTESIHKKIEQISQEIGNTKNLIADLSSENDRLKSELANSMTGWKTTKKELAKSQSLILELEKVVASKNEQNSSHVPVNDNRDKEIDELVKEIEYCIGQLRK